MLLRKLASIFACALLVGAASFAMAGVPDLDNSTATTYSGAGTPVMLNLPGGGGIGFNVASVIGGSVDATINLELLDGTMAPVANFPAEDLWLETSDPGQEYSFSACTAGTIADGDTDDLGLTEWAFPLSAGGASQTVTYVMVSGEALTSNAGLALWHNSPDITSDGIVNLSDVPEFAGDFFGGLDPFRSDFEYDGDVNLSDVVKLAQALQAQCQ
jgi:hypothetical protein